VGVVALLPKIWEIFLAASHPQYKEYYFLFSKVAFFIPFLWALWSFLKIYAHSYELTTERLLEHNGVFSRTSDELELYRVKDITFVQPFSLRMFNCGNIILDTSDRSTPVVVIHAIENGRPVMNAIRKYVDIMRTKKGVREID
jgi:uncharacterized membrane protein YdbT with pleckstrin-like domain